MMNQINEKLSISDNVQNEVIKFNDYLKNKSCNYLKDCNFDYIFFEIPFKIYFRFNELTDNHFGQTNLLINALYIAHCKGVDIMNTLYHEILHIFQYAKNKKIHQNDIFYKIACNIIEKQNSEADLLFAYALYASFDFEQDAMIHGLYGALHNLPSVIAKSYLNNSEEYAYVLDLKNALFVVNKNPVLFNEKLFKMNIFQYKQIIQKGLNRFESKICKLMQKIKDSDLNEGLIHIYHHYPQKYGHLKNYNIQMKTKEDEQYQEYLTNHIANVQKGFQWLVDKHIVKDDNCTLRKQIEQHDQSKYSEDEWNAYRDYFYANGDETAFNKAWLHHIHNNPHHWQHWVLINDDGTQENHTKTVCIQIPKNYIVEMICDWWAFSWSKDNLSEIFNWYDKNKNNMLLHEQSRKDIESLLNVIKGKL